MTDRTVEDTAEEPRAGFDYQPGQQIAARYEVIELLGRGATASVYRVLDHVTGEQVAVKLMGDPEGGAEALRREVRLAWRVTHPHVVRVFDIVEHHDGVLLSMQYAAGGTLEARLGRAHDEAEVTRWGLEILSALEAAHGAGVVHRDLKPANILFDDRDRVLLTDFGVAQLAGRPGQAGRGGTPAWMAPEQLRGETLDGRTDLYALGLILTACLTGGRDPAAVPGRLGPVLRAFTAEDPALRPADAAAARALWTPPAPRWRAWALGAVLVMLLVALVGAVAMRPGPPVEPQLTTLTSGDEVIRDPVTSLPDGTLVFASNRRGGNQLWAQDGDTARPLTVGPGDKSAPQFVDGRLYFHVAADRGFDLYALDDFAGAHTLEDAERVAADVRSARVASDGRIVTLKPREGFDHQARIAVRGPDGERELGPEGQQITRVDWSPDGRHLAFAAREDLKEERGSLWLLDVETDRSTLLTDDVGAWTGFVWLDDATVAFLRGAADARSLVAIDVRNGAEQVVARRLAHATLPALTADGALIYVTDRVEYGVWVTGQRGLDRVTSFGADQAMSPSWVPATDELAYLVEAPGRGHEARRVDAATFGEVRARRVIDGDNPYVAFSEDGRRVAYARNDASGSGLFVVTLDDDAPPVRLATNDTEHAFVVMQFSGDRLTYVLIGTAGQSDIRDVRLDGTGDRLLVEGAGGGLRSRDGRWLSYQRERFEQAGGVVVQRTEDGLPTGEAQVVPHTAEAHVMRFGPGASEITVADAYELFSVDLETGERRSLAALPRGTYYVDRFSVHPDGRIAIMLGVGRRSLVRIGNLDQLF